MESKLFKYVVPMCLTGQMSLASCSSDDSVGAAPDVFEAKGSARGPGRALRRRNDEGGKEYKKHFRVGGSVLVAPTGIEPVYHA